jgi:hypothetical protein
MRSLTTIVDVRQTETAERETIVGDGAAKDEKYSVAWSAVHANKMLIHLNRNHSFS